MHHHILSWFPLHADLDFELDHRNNYLHHDHIFSSRHFRHFRNLDPHKFGIGYKSLQLYFGNAWDQKIHRNKNQYCICERYIRQSHKSNIRHLTAISKNRMNQKLSLLKFSLWKFFLRKFSLRKFSFWKFPLRKFSLRKLSLGLLCLGKLYLEKLSLGKFYLRNNSLWKVSLRKVSLRKGKVSLGKLYLLKVSLRKVSLRKVSLRKVSLQKFPSRRYPFRSYPFKNSLCNLHFLFQWCGHIPSIR